MKKMYLPFMMILVFILGTVPQAFSSSGSPTAIRNWDEVVSAAEGQTVNIYMWGGNNGTNLYLDRWVAPRLRSRYQINLRRVPVTDIRQTINKLLTEKKLERSGGSVDVIWINGENFRLARENELLFGPFTSTLPNYKRFIEEEGAPFMTDFGHPVDGYEAPWGKAQFVFVYDESKVGTPHDTIEELGRWIKENPGRFTYPSPPDFTGSCFVRHLLIEEYGGYQQYLELKGKDLLTAGNRKVWDILNELEPYLWRKGSTYPDSIGVLDQLYANGEVWMTMNYNPLHALNQINNSFFPGSSRTFVLRDGTFSNTHYLAIPFNSGSKEGAMVAIDFLLSPEAQIEKFKPSVWGDGMVVDISRLGEKEKDLLDNIDLGSSVISPEILKEKSIPEFSSQYIDQIEKEWMENVAKQ
jgi:putative spermidine/putrescine transport system substrate-binding protein